MEQYKKDYDELKKSISEVSGELTKAIEKLSSLFSEEKEKQGVDELKMAVKARDDQIDALKKKNEILSKSDVDGKEPKTVNKSEDELDDIIETYDDDGIFVKDGTVSRSKLVY